MRYLNPILGFLLFLVALGFALKNAEPITLRYYLGFAWHAPLSLTLLVAFVAGIVVALIAFLSHIVNQRKRIRALQHELDSLHKSQEFPPV